MAKKIEQVNDLTKFFVLTAVLCCLMSAVRAEALPKGFVYVNDVVPNVVIEMKYYGSDNFVGAPVNGYEAPVAISTVEAAAALKNVAAILEKQGYFLKIFDAYRPEMAVRHFVRWSEDPDDTKTKAEYYPTFSKPQLFALGYIASSSSHSRGSTFDLTMVNKKTIEEIDMGSPFDFFGSISAHDSPLINEQQRRNRKILKFAMEKAGFKGVRGEWWHYTLRSEPFPKKRFDFPVK